MKKALYVATVDIHIKSFHLPYLEMLHNMGYEVHVATNGDEQFPFCDKKHTICIERSPFKLSNLKAIKQLKKIIDDENYDLIHCHTPMGSVVTRLASKEARKYGAKVFYTCHGFHFYKGSPIINWLLFYPVEKYLAKYTDTLITINQEDYRLAKTKFSKRCKNIEYIPGVGIDPKKFDFKLSEKEKIELRKSLGLKKDDFVMIYPARLDKNKNQGFLINCMEEIVKKYNNIHLLLPGTDELNGYYQKIVEKKQLQSNIHFLGRREDIPSLLKISDLAVSSSKREGLPINIIEAMCCNLPIVVLECRGMSDLVTNKVNGYIVLKNDFVKSITKIYTKKSFRVNNDEKINKLNLIYTKELLKKMYESKIETLKEQDKISDSKNPLVSVIMAEYNTEKKLLKESISSILHQTYENFELILIDDCGKNNVEQIVKEFKDKRIKVYKNEKNSGLVFSLNKALEYAKGKYIIRMDTDDYSYPDRFEKQVLFIENNSHFSVVGSRANFYDGNKIYGNSKFRGKVTKENMLSGSPIIHPSVIALKDSIIKAGGYPNYKRCEDYALWLEMFSKGYNFYVMDNILLRYHLSIKDYNKRTLKTRKDYFRLLKEIYQKLHPTKLMYYKMIIKTVLAGIIPYKVIFMYHKLIFKKK